MKTGEHISQNQKSKIGIRTPSKSNADQWNLSAEYIHSIDPEQQEYALYFFATWLVRAILQRVGVEANTSLPADDSSQHALTSHPNKCTVGTLRYCKTGGSNK
ncbi:MAG: hypothetical protein P9X24_13185 [Candidatus Hatepunaea meridiana]|nr:hypothetical protein [Candidatus Hatepunaea meridiana]